MLIAVDFDGTIVEHRYPRIGKEIPFATATLKKLASEGHRFVLWTVREGKLLDEAVDWCKSRGLEFQAVNNDVDDISGISAEGCSKPRVDMFIDDRNVGGLPDWGAIYEMIHKGITYKEYLEGILDSEPEPEPSFFKRLFGRH